MSPISIHSVIKRIEQQIPLFSSPVSCGFPSPADDHIHKSLDFNEYLIRKQSATFVVRAAGNSMIDAGIMKDDLLVIDRSLTPQNGSIVLAILDGEFTVKRYRRRGSVVFLEAANVDYSPIEIGEGRDCEICGVVTFAIHSLHL